MSCEYFDTCSRRGTQTGCIRSFHRCAKAMIKAGEYPGEPGFHDIYFGDSPNPEQKAPILSEPDQTPGYVHSSLCVTKAAPDVAGRALSGCPLSGIPTDVE